MRRDAGIDRRRPIAVVALAGVWAALLLAGVLAGSSRVEAGSHAVDLGTAGTYSVLGGQTVTNTGPSVLSGDLGVSPGTAITGFPPGIVLGTVHTADDAAAQAQSDLVIAYDDAAGRAPTAAIAGDLVGQTLTAGVYNSTGPIALSGTLTLDAQGDPNAVFIFQVASTLITASDSTVSLINGAQACNVFWQIGSSATLGTDSAFVGTILALSSITVNTDATVEGRALARNGSVTLDSNIFTTAECQTEPTTTTDSSTTSTTGPTTSTTSRTTTTNPRTTTTRATGTGRSGGTPGSPGLARTGGGLLLGAPFAVGVLLIVVGGLLLAIRPSLAAAGKHRPR